MLYKKIRDTITSLPIESISPKRKETLQPLIDYIQPKVAYQKGVRLSFICTHNSRRSQLSQVWAQAMAHYFKLKNVWCYSGGTEATELFPIVAKTLKISGFRVTTISEGKNRVYSIKYSANEHPIIGFSKTFNDLFNPQSAFAAIMTCSQANEACPIISGAEKRIPLEYEDPKKYDDMPQQAEKYKERSLQIATEMMYVFSQIKS